MVVIEPLKVNVCGQVALKGGVTKEDAFRTAKSGAGVVGGGLVDVPVGVLCGVCAKPKLKLLTVPQPSKFTASVKELVENHPAGCCA